MPRSEEVATRPALVILAEQQKELIDHETYPVTDLGCSLRHGFRSRRELVGWYQAAIVRTFGAIASEFPAEWLNGDRVTLQALLTDDERQRRWTRSNAAPMDELEAAKTRRAIEQSRLLPAMNDAFNTLRPMAGEYTDDRNALASTDDLEASEQSVALRPAFSRKDLEQRHALNRLWDGLEDEDALRDWLHDLDLPTNGALDREFARRVTRDRVLKSWLIRGREDERVSRFWRVSWAVTKLLPAFVRGIERMDGGELVKRSSGGLEVAQA